MFDTMTTRTERAERYILHVARCRHRRRILAIQWASVAAVLSLGFTVLYLLSVTEVF